MPGKQFTRRTFTATASGIAAGVFITGMRQASGQQTSPEAATPVSVQPQGFVSTRIRTVESEDARAEINELVLNQFAPDVVSLDGFEGYILGDVIDEENAASLSILVLEEQSQMAAFEDLAADFVSNVEDSVSTVGTEQWVGNLLITGQPETSNATPMATPAGPSTEGYVALRVHTSTPGTDPRDFVPLATSGFLPIVAGMEGFQGYLWYPTDGGFVAISLFDSAESAKESNAAAKDWSAEFLTEYTDGNPEIYNANVVYRNLPILR